jgi:hypothetical protein
MGRTPNTGRVPTPSNQGIVNKILGIPTRSLSGLDAVNVGAMSDAGINLDRARRLTLAGKPETKTGRRVVGLIEGLKPFSHIPIPFARVGVHTLEQAGISSDPAAKWRRLVSLGLGGAAYKWGDMVPPEYTPYMTALAGPYALPVAAGIATKHATEAAKDPEAALVSELGRQIPYPIGQNPLRAFLPEQLAREFYPNILRDVARFGDPYERSIKSPPGMFPTPSTAIGEFETLRAKVPGESGRESLPGASRRRDIFGEELAGRKNNPFKRFITSEPMTYDPYPDTPEVNTVREANIKMRPPAYTRQVTIGGLSIPLTPEESEGFQMLSREDLRKKLVDYTNSDRFKNLDDSKKTFALKTFLRMMNQMGSMKAKAGTLKNVDKSQVEQAVDKYKKERGVK